ncbi:hypothetical protein [Brevundimonas sp. Root1423]|uniref:hypothetical protein n=1 Tax=Brevundimonas sp. Root1423 TaxID=1736462 RepID=UPI0006F9B9FF|nr:hypothetical protein [Brevundimonas sp. Root1423]KQY96636.1 hypothetical protein ASD25_01970 [Brevundimonas sp. Root1423]
MFETTYSQILTGLIVLVVSFALIKGDEPERIGGAAYALIMIAGVMTWEGGNVSLPAWGPMALDMLLLAVLVGLAFHSRRAWPVWAAAFQALIVTSHVMLAVDLRPPADAVAAVNNLANYGVLIAMAVGTFWAWQERRALRPL